jgi:hypothetical protein
MTYSKAFEELRKGKGMRLPIWMPDMIVRGHFPTNEEELKQPFLYMHTKSGMYPWIPTMLALYSEDWEVVD